MSHGECGVVGNNNGMGGGGGVTTNNHKKIRRKRKELDALVPEEKVRRKSSSASHHDLLRSDSDDPEADFASGSVTGVFRSGFGGIWTCLPGVCTLLLLLTTLVGVAAALRLLMLTRKDLDSLHMRVNAVEASSSELPAKFHQSHVHLQELEKNQTALWSAVNNITITLNKHTNKISELESGIKNLKESLAGTPQLSSLPKHVQDLQASVSTIGSSLQDVQSALKTVRQEHDNIDSQVKSAEANVIGLKQEISTLQNETSVSGSTKTIGDLVSSLQSELSLLSSNVTLVNSSLQTHLISSPITVQNLESSYKDTLLNLTNKINSLESLCSRNQSVLPGIVSNLTSAVSELQQMKDNHTLQIQALNQNIDMVIGIEKKLRGTQVQMASGTSELKKQLRNVEDKLDKVTSENNKDVTTSQSNDTPSRSVQSAQKDGKENQPNSMK